MTKPRLTLTLPFGVLDNYRRLHDGLSDMIEGGRLTRAAIPDDYDWLVESMVWLAGHDPVAAKALDENLVAVEEAVSVFQLAPTEDNLLNVVIRLRKYQTAWIEGRK